MEIIASCSRNCVYVLAWTLETSLDQIELS